MNRTSTIMVKTRGEKWQSSKYRPRLYVKIEPEPSTVKEILHKLEHRLCELIVGIKDTPWWAIRPCEHCLKRVKTELANPSTWQRRLCLRHYVLHQLQFNVYDNKEHMLYAKLEPLTVVIHGGTNNYRYVIVLEEEKATLTLCGFKYYRTKFTYRRHLNAYPLLSSYDYIIKFIINDVISNIEDLLREVKRAREGGEELDYDLVLV